MRAQTLDPDGADLSGETRDLGSEAGRPSRAEIVAIGATIAAFVVAAIAVLRVRYAPVGDIAMMDMLTLDVPSNLPLVGVYSRFGWSHPGPIQLWWLAGFGRLFGPTNGLMVGSLAWHLVALVLAWWMARRIARAAGWCVLIGLLAVLAASSAQMGHSPWNPYVSLVGAGTLVVAAWATGERQPWAPVVLVGVGSVLVQAHVATLPLVGIMVLVAAGRRSPDLPAVARVGRRGRARPLDRAAARPGRLELTQRHAPPDGWRGPDRRTGPLRERAHPSLRVGAELAVGGRVGHTAGG